MPFDLDRTLRELKPQKAHPPLLRRPDIDLLWADDLSPIGPPLLLDTTVYIDVMQARAPASVEALLQVRVCHHSSVCLAELTHAFGRLNPAHAKTKTVLRALRDVINAIPDHRLHAPTDATWGDAGILVGMISRLCGDLPDTARHFRLMNDVLIALQARRLGLNVLTGNAGDFDRIGQLLPQLDLVLYRPTGHPA